MAGRPAQARVQRCGKSAPASGATPAARQPPPGARSNRGHGWPGRCASASPRVDRVRWMAAEADPRKGPLDRIPRTGPLTVWGPFDQHVQPAAVAAGPQLVLSSGRSCSPRHRFVTVEATCCEVCPGSGGVYAVGRCTSCGRHACASHLVVSARENSYEWSAEAVFATRDRAVLVPLSREGGRDVADARIRAWCRGTSVCTDCRAHASREAADLVLAREVAERSRIDRIERSLSEMSPTDVLAAIAASGEHLNPAAVASEWPRLVPVLPPATHDVVDVNLSRGVLGSRAVEAARTPSWSAPSGFLTRAGDSEGGYFDADSPGFVASDGRAFVSVSKAYIVTSAKSAAAVVAVRAGEALRLSASKTGTGGLAWSGAGVRVNEAPERLGHGVIALVKALAR
jgi:hypothetical protein